MSVVTKRSSMVFFSDGGDHYSHRVRIVLAEKGVTVDVVECSDQLPAELADLNPYNSLPTLVDRDLVLYEPNVMMEYLDERFPHPPLLPVYPVARAQARLLIHRVEKDWSTHVDQILSGRYKDSTVNKLRKELREMLIGIAPIFDEKPYFMSEEFSLIDCCAAPIMWRLPLLGIDLNIKRAKPLLDYMDRVFARESFQSSLSEIEREMRSDYSKGK